MQKVYFLNNKKMHTRGFEPRPTKIATSSKPLEMLHTYAAIGQFVFIIHPIEH
jgi:hypothetical protein